MTRNNLDKAFFETIRVIYYINKNYILQVLIKFENGSIYQVWNSFQIINNQIQMVEYIEGNEN